MFATLYNYTPRIVTATAVAGALTAYAYMKPNTTSVMVRVNDTTHKHLISMRHPRALFQPEKIPIARVRYGDLSCFTDRGYTVKHKEFTNIVGEPQTVLEVEARTKAEADNFFALFAEYNCQATIEYPYGGIAKQEKTERLSPFEFPRTDSSSTISDIRTHVRHL